MGLGQLLGALQCKRSFTKLSELQKINYLTNSLKGEPLQSIKRFQITKDNYEKAIEFLTKKYGNSEELILQLLQKLNNISLSSPGIREQRVLLEQIQIIISQMIQKQENVDNQCMYEKVLSKFSIKTQRKVLDKKITTKDKPYNMQQLLHYLEEVISNEEWISHHTSQSTITSSGSANQYRNWNPTPLMPSCMYCKGNHKPFYCDKYKTPQERSQYLLKNKLCYICASPFHITSQCKREPCHRCQKRHHASCCFHSTTKEIPATPLNGDAKKDIRNNKNRIEERKTFNSNINQVNEKSLAEKKTAMPLSERLPSTFLPTAEITVMSPITKQLEKVAILLDTGAELSFIDTELAEKLRLPSMEEAKLHLQTFGFEKVLENTSRKVPLYVWDEDGYHLSLYLFTHETITKSCKLPPITPEDIDFIQEHNLQIDTTRKKSSVKPSILLGCDQLWTIIKNDRPPIELPSGLHLLPTRFGQLITGKLKNPLHLQQRENDNVLQIKENEDEVNEWDKRWTLEGQVNATLILTPNDEDDDSVKWEKYWTLESSGTEEFSTSEKEEKSLNDQRVCQNFNKTIEKRPDGYYVRLPWKELPISLPDNRAIALSRPASVWKSLKNNNDLLNMYNGIFEEQLRMQILEEINEEETQVSRVYYIPYQAVLSPNKTTTKLRIVYDASSHYKGCPSLNDVLHRGPVILPQLFGVLLRFRFGKIAITSDVEKAFLQVRLHEDDRSATRCLWLHDHKSPPTSKNIKVLRFTRVTFGLSASPFLLAGTIHFHLNQYNQDIELVTELKNNLYVDNLILTVDELEESWHVYSRTKQISQSKYNDLHMNLREFASISTDLMAKIITQDKSGDQSPKILGIPWNIQRDYLQLSCSTKVHPNITKRTVASAIASVYDPLGLLLPLLHKAKVFLRYLWKEKYNWDSTLPEACNEKWIQISQEMRGFTKSIPRCLDAKGISYTLVTFADASTEAVAACVYLRSGNSSNLLIAKSKLPPLKSAPTMPKMELDAVTLTLRLTNAILTQLRGTLTVEEIFILSDSEIVLSWIKQKPLRNAGLRVFNRLIEIEKIVENIRNLGHRTLFGHIESQHNAADCATRGLSQKEFTNHFWWTGPSFLLESPENWKANCNIFEYNETSTEFSESHYNQNLKAIIEESDQDEHELLLTRYTHSNKHNEDDIISLLKKYLLQNAKRIVSIILRYIRILIIKVNSRIQKHIKLSRLAEFTETNNDSQITGKEITIAGKLLVRQHQQSTITAAILQSMKHLNVKPDEEGLLRCFGRLRQSDLESGSKNPLLILQKSWLAEAIINDCRWTILVHLQFFS